MVKLKEILTSQIDKNIKSIQIGEQKYKFNTLLFGIGMLLLTFFAVGILMHYGMDKQNKIYISCPTDGVSQCENSLYKTDFCYKYLNNYICEQEYLPKGFVYGTPPPTIYKQFNTIVILYLIFLFLVNHWLHNRNFHLGKFKEFINEEEKVKKE
jgi:hypothetical protein